MNKDLLEQIKQSVVFIGGFQINEKGTKDHILFGTGVILNIEGSFHLVTAKHVILDPASQKQKVRKNLYFFLNGKTKETPVYAIPYEYIKQKKWKWIYHSNKDVDLAVTPFLLDPQNHGVKTIPVDFCLGLEEIFETNDIFYLSFQPGVSKIELDKAVKPVVRRGTISRLNNDKSFFIDGFAFPGNSGSPVFMLPSAIKFTDKGINLGSDRLGGRLIGIIGEYLPYRDIAYSKQTGRPRVVFEENTGLSKVWSVDLLKEILSSDKFKKSLEKVKEDD